MISQYSIKYSEEKITEQFKENNESDSNYISPNYKTISGPVIININSDGTENVGQCNSNYKCQIIEIVLLLLLFAVLLNLILYLVLIGINLS